MKKISLVSLAFGALLAASSIVPASAMPSTSQPAHSQSSIEKVRVIVKYGNWRGHRGYRIARPGYRRHGDGFWYPRAAFTVRVAPSIRIRVGGRHIGWCRDRYMTYRASDNTFVAIGGVRRVCRSPY